MAQSFSQSSPASAGGRDLALDAARAFAVIAMVFGHTLHATLSKELRGDPAVQTYWEFRALTAPLFLTVSGWAVSVALLRSGRGATGRSPLGERLPRVLLLLGVGALLRFPLWNLRGLLEGDAGVWAHFAAFDALHCVGASLLAGAAVFQFARTPRARIVTFAALAVLLPLVASAAWAALGQAPLFVRLALGSASSPFPLVPWAGYFFAGALIGTATEGISHRSRALLLFVTGAALVLVAGAPPPGAGLPATDPVQHAWRLGMVVLLLSAMAVVPARLAHRLAPVGRAALVVYVVHLVLVYGWGRWPGLATRIGPKLALVEALALGVVVFAASCAAAYALRLVRLAPGPMPRPWWSSWPWPWRTPAPAEEAEQGAAPDAPPAGPAAA